MKKGWQTRRLGDFCTIASGGTPSKENPRFWVGDLPFVSARDLKSDRIETAFLHISREAVEQSATKLAPVGSLLMLVRGMGLANGIQIGEVTAPVAFNQDLRAIQPPLDSVLPRFLLLALRNNFNNGEEERVLSAAAHGTLKIDADALRQIALPLPPLAEQQRIVGLLDEAFEGLATAKANTEKNLQNARALFESHLQSVFTQRGPGWVEHTLGDLIEIQNGYAFKSTDYTDAGYFVIRISNVQDGEITLANPRFIKLVDKKLERFILNDGDILISLTGNIGRVGIIQEDQLPAVLNQRVARITVKDQSADRDFLFRFLLSRTFRESLQEAGHGAAQQNVSTKEIEAVRLSLPNKKEQRRIVREFDNFAEETQRLARLYERKHAALEALKKSLLHQAFTGAL